MFHSIEECTDFIFKLRASTYKGKPLEAVRRILFELDNPHEKVKFIHFAGSNGKGSTLNATREILMEHGMRIGAFISPHLERVNERITIDNEQITDEDFLKYANSIDHIIRTKLDGQYPSFFEIMTVIACLHFANEAMDVALMETGIGGRIDSTNIITPEVSVITTISLEHTEILGDTIEKIAYEKAGIVKPGKPVVVGVKQSEAREVIKQKAIQCHSECFSINEEIMINNIKKGSPQYFDFSFGDVEINHIPIAMQGHHQIHNAALAIAASYLFDPAIAETTIRNALRKARWEGRFERLNNQVIIDGAHNSEGTEALINTLIELYPDKKYRFIYAALQDKDHAVSISMMDQVAASMSFTQIDLPRAAKAAVLASQSNHSNIRFSENWEQVIKDEITTLQENELLIITGSLYFIAEARKFLVEKVEIRDTEIG
ncbi:bifunctional folylpolyglutamate synthase/dihydrofolate synthase [Ureibacillus sinduriensis]|uniref:tetrahydrofolate synthase n=1 Tax=Ureibacillus sinduriensis BLB-1 = JCM 15800 TaxID=1384057 RepID=A0A0A3HT87_9BACL|nr:folylpolyglutamate synthase/dihydrofolate synthase family protein [Ureibacillus sinduriensis]KGR74425.1 folylpolyglutamate synthase [Ureibacillus sinduriensis BLB-1 = JCM 15800]